MEIEMKVGDFMLIKEGADVSANPYALVAKKNNLPVIMYSKHNDDTINVYTDGISTNSFQQHPFTLVKDSFIKITEEEYEKRKKIVNAEYFKELKIKKKILRPRRVAITDRKDYDT